MANGGQVLFLNPIDGDVNHNKDPNELGPKDLKFPRREGDDPPLLPIEDEDDTGMDDTGMDDQEGLCARGRG